MNRKKRTIGLLLTLVMLLGMTPVSVGATDGDNPGEGGGLRNGLYLTISDTGELSNLVPIQKETMENGNEVSGYFGISYTALQEKTVYYYQQGCTEVTAGENDAVSVAETAYDGIYAITLAAGCRGRISADLRFDKNGFPIVFDDGSKQMYYYNDSEKKYYTGFGTRIGAKVYLQLAVEDADGNKHDVDGTYTYTASVGSVVWDEVRGCLMWDLENAEPGEGWICASKDGVDYLVSVKVNPPQGNGDGSGNGGDNNLCGKLISAAHETKDEDIYAGSIPERNGDNSAAVAFPYGGKIYYMGVTMHGFFYPNIGGSMGPTLRENEYEDVAYDIGFYVSEGDEAFDRIKDQALIDKLTSAFTKLEVKVWALPNNIPGYETPAVFPAIYESTRNSACAECTVLKLGVEHRGNYLITATGVLDGRTYETYTFLEWDCRKAIYFEYEGASSEFIAQANTFLAGLQRNDTATAIINIPAGVYDGYIIVPGHLGRMIVEINGCFENGGTVLRGGIISNAQFAAHVEKISFVGNGREQSKAKDGVTPNHALTGNGYVKARRCSFTDYQIALDGEERHKSAIDCTFTNNGTAICFGNGDVAGDPTYSGNTFRGNGIALDFQNVPKEHPMTFFDFECNRFIDNEVDIWNRLGRRIFIPGCYFAKTENETEVVRECVYRPIGNQQGEGGGNLKKQVLYYPQAADPDFETYIFETDFYGGKSPIVSVNFTKTFLIPAGALDGATFTVMKHDELLARITFAPAAATYSLRRSMGTFDATVELLCSEDGKSMTVTLQEIPGGRTPTVSVPCADGWKSVEVKDAEGAILESTIEDGLIRFVVGQGGSYTIVNTTAAAELPAPKPGGGSTGNSSISSTTKNPDGSTTTTQVNKVTGTVTESTKHADGSTETVKTEMDGTVTTQMAAADGSKSETVTKDGVQSSEVSISGKAVKDAAENGMAVALPIPEVKVESSAAKAASVTVALPGGVKNAQVEIPVENISAGTVAVIVHADGTEEVIRSSVPTEDGIALTVESGATVKIVDLSRDFSDVADTHTFNDAIDFASARGIIEGYGNGSFGVGSYATSAATATVIARIMGEDFYGTGATAKARDWAKENGIAAGLDLSGNVSRAEFMVMLWRAAGCPEVIAAELDFVDASERNGVEKAAIAWAVENHVIGGYGDGTVRPDANITRGAMAAIAQRYMMK